MGKPLEHLVDIKAVPVSDLNDLIISQHKVNGQLVILSRYRDMRWNLSPYIQTRNHRDFKIIFNSRLENGDLLTDNKNKGLLESAKRFLYVRWKHKSPHSGKYISARSLFNNWIVLRPLLSWMIREGLSSFSELTPGKCLDFVRFCQAEKTLNKSTQTIAYRDIVNSCV